MVARYKEGEGDKDTLFGIRLQCSSENLSLMYPSLTSTTHGRGVSEARVALQSRGDVQTRSVYYASLFKIYGALSSS